MPKKMIKDVFLREKKETIPLNEELKMEKIKRGGLFLKLILICVLLVLLAGFGFVFMGKMSSATFSVVLKNEYADVNSDIKAYREPLNGASAGAIFEVMGLDAEDSSPITATGVSKGGQKASGKIIIYNNYSSASQKLIATTRFETKDGKVYRIPKAVVVPGMGSVETVVYADAPGESYNIGLVEFTAPGLKGGPRYEKIFAKSKTEMTGGSSGNARVVRAEDIASAKSEATDRIKKKLTESFLKQKPEGYLLYDGAIKIEFIDDSGNPKEGSVVGAGISLYYKTKGIAVGYLLEKESLSKALVKNNGKKLSVKVGENDDVSVWNLEDLKFKLISSDLPARADSRVKEIAVNINGNAHFVWNVDTKKLAAALAGQKIKKIKKGDAVLPDYPSIKKATALSKPSWWYKLPSNPSRIKISLNADEK